MKTNMKKKGFTLVELLVVIAIVAILAVVSVVGYTAFINKAHESNDRSLVAQLNKTLTGAEFDGPHGAFEAVRASGFDVSKIEATANDQAILWDNTAKEFFYTADESRTGDIWIVDDAVSDTYNTYYVGTADIDFDGATKIIVYTNDPELNIKIDAPEAHVEHEGKAGTIEVLAVDDHSYYENGMVRNLEIKIPAGKVVINGTVAKLVAVEGATAEISLTASSEVVNFIVNSTSATVVVDAKATVGSVATEEDAVVEKGLGNIVTGADDVIVEGKVDASKISDFAGGFGTPDFPYIIANAQQLANISNHYDTYNYYKVANGVTSLDLTGVGKLKLNGQFDGNGTNIVNLTTALFEVVGVGGGDSKNDMKISNLTATMKVSDGRALVRSIYHTGNTIFENVTLHGEIEGQYNMGSFYNYGTANAPDSEGADYTVTFINAKSDVTLVCTTGNTIGGMLGHGYEGKGNTLTINIDKNSGYTGKMYTTTGKDCHQLMAMCSNGKYVLNDNEISGYTVKYPSTKLTLANPVAGETGYTVTPVEDAATFVVYLNSQLTAYDEEGNKIQNLSGITGYLEKEEMSATDGKILDNFDSAVIVNGADYERGYEVKNGVLTVYTGSSSNYASGWVTLQVNQYDAEGNLLATGTLPVHTFDEPSAE